MVTSAKESSRGVKRTFCSPLSTTFLPTLDLEFTCGTYYFLIFELVPEFITGLYKQRTLVQFGVATNLDKIRQAPLAVRIHHVAIPQAAIEQVQTQFNLNKP